MGKIPLIVLLSDFGTDSPYVAQMKAVILRFNPQVQMVDLTHAVTPQNIMEGTFILVSSYRYFPSGTIFIAVVDPTVGTKRRLICLTTKDYTFLAPDNGLLSLIAERPVRIVEITNRRYFRTPVSATFHGRDILAPVAAHLTLGLSPARLGPAIPRIKSLRFPLPIVRGQTITGEVIYIDRFGNLITNIPAKLVNQTDSTVRIKGKQIKHLMHTYAEVPRGTLTALVGSSNYLEIAVNQGNAATLLKASPGMKVIINRR